MCLYRLVDFGGNIASDNVLVKMVKWWTKIVLKYNTSPLVGQQEYNSVVYSLDVV